MEQSVMFVGMCRSAVETTYMYIVCFCGTLEREILICDSPHRSENN